MSAKAIQREQLREALLVCAESSKPHGVSIAIFKREAWRMGHKVTEDEIRAEVSYLIDKGLLAEAEKRLSPENKLWRVTASGSDYVAEHNLLLE